jgi:hypothetical protein
MLSVREEKSGRKKRQVAALKASGQKLREVPRAAASEPKEDRPSQQHESSTHIEL